MKTDKFRYFHGRTDENNDKLMIVVCERCKCVFEAYQEGIDKAIRIMRCPKCEYNIQGAYRRKAISPDALQ